MDMRLTAKPQTLTLFSSSPSLSTSKFRSIRKEFLGCGQNLTSPGTIRSRRRNRNSGLHSHSSRFIFKASLSSNSVLIVVGLVTLSAVSVVYYLSRVKSKNISVEVTILTSGFYRCFEIEFSFSFFFPLPYFDFTLNYVVCQRI